jgi:hypothetical protein
VSRPSVAAASTAIAPIPTLRDNLLGLAEEYSARANALEKDDKVVWHAGSDDEGAA